MLPVAGGGESTAERIARLVAEGRMPSEAVSEAERLWRKKLANGVPMPNGETVRVTLDDLYHVIVDARIWRRPERVDTALRHVFEIREAEGGRRQAFSRWAEADSECLASIILEADSRLWSLHLIDERRLQRYIRRGGEVLWSV